MDALNKIRLALPQVPPQQMIIALDAIAGMFAREYLDHNPLPAEATPEEVAALLRQYTAQTLETVLNGAAEIILGTHAQEAKQANAADIAQAAIAKAAGKLI